MSAKREQIQDALLTRLRLQVPGLISTNRRYVGVSELAALQQPALSVVAVSGMAARAPGMPPRWTQHAMAILYVREPADMALTVETQLFALMDLVEGALQLQPREQNFDDITTTLGGLVRYCHHANWVLHHGLGEGQAGASLSIEMLALQ